MINYCDLQPHLCGFFIFEDCTQDGHIVQKDVYIFQE